MVRYWRQSSPPVRRILVWHTAAMWELSGVVMGHGAVMCWDGGVGTHRLMVGLFEHLGIGGGDNVYVSLKISNKLKACCPRLPFSGQFLASSLSQKNQNQSIRNVCNEKRTLNFDFENKLLTNKINSIYQK